MFKRRVPLSRGHGEVAGPDAAKGEIAMVFEDQPIRARRGDSVAAAVLGAAERDGQAATRRSPVSGQPRAPYCLMGVCYECLMEIDGRPNQQACMIAAREGMRVRRQRGPAAVPLDPVTTASDVESNMLDKVPAEISVDYRETLE